MSLNRGMRVDRGYATVAHDDGVNYREIAELMTELGFMMNHSSARNYIIRVMRKFAAALADENDVDVDEMRVDEIAKDPSFQRGIAELLQVIEVRRRAQRDT
jgi:transposase-like protein